MEAKSKSNQKWIIILLIALIAALGVVLGVVIYRGNLRDISDDGVPGIGYATDAAVMLTQEELQAAMDAAMENARNGSISLRYRNNAYSTDGTNFSCYIVNSPRNIYDMFLTIFADAAMTDQLFLSQLVPPGSGFNQIALEHPLDVGDHTVYVAMTQVKRDEETGEESICNQVVHTMDFHVTAEETEE